MTIAEIRRANLQALIDDRFNGVIRRFAKEVERQDQVIGRYLHKDPTKRKQLGNDMCRHIEQMLKLPNGYMDKEHDSDLINGASVMLKEHFGDLCIRQIIRWQDVGAYMSGEPVKAVGAFAMPAGAGEQAFFTHSPHDTTLLRRGDLLAFDPSIEPVPGQVVLARVNNMPWSSYALSMGRVEGEAGFAQSLGGEPVFTSNFLIGATLIFSAQGLQI